MKKLLSWLLLIILLPVSYFAYGLMDKHLIRLQFFSSALDIEAIPTEEVEFQRSQATDPLGKPIVLFLLNGITEEEADTLTFSSMALTKGSKGYYPVYPIHDSDLVLKNIITGVSPHRGGYLSDPASDNLDTIFLSATAEKYPTAYFGNHLPAPLEDTQETITDQNIIPVPDQEVKIKISASFVEPIQNSEELNDWLEQYAEKLLLYQFLVFDISVPANKKDVQQRNLELSQVDEAMKSILLTCGEEAQYYFTVPISFTDQKRSFIPQYTFYSPFYVFGKSIKFQTNFEKTHLENLTSSLCFSLGLPSSNKNIAVPQISLFELPEDVLMHRYISYVNGQMMSYMNVLLEYGVNEETVASFILHANDSIHSIPSKDLAELSSRVDTLQKEFFSFLESTNSDQKKKELLFFIILLAFILIVWLLFSPWNFRGYLMGIGFSILFLGFNYLVFHNHLTIPPVKELSLEWHLFRYGLPFLATCLLAGSITTLLDGYLFNIEPKEIQKDLNGQIGTFLFFILLETSLLGIQFGYTIQGSLESFSSQLLFFRNESLLIILPIGLLVMYGTSYAIYSFLTQKNRKSPSYENKT